VEASEKSGSLITARLANDAGRHVLAVPGRVDAPNSRGVHALLRDGAGLAEGPDDVLDALGIPRPATSPVAPVPLGAEARILGGLDGGEPRDADQIAAVTGLPVAEVRAALVDLEVEGAIVAFPGGRYARA